MVWWSSYLPLTLVIWFPILTLELFFWWMHIKMKINLKKWVGSSPFKKARGSLRVWVLPITLPTKDIYRQTSVLFMVHWCLYCLAFYVPTYVAPLALWWGTHSLQLRLSDQTFVCLKCFWCLPSFILFWRIDVCSRILRPLMSQDFWWFSHAQMRSDEFKKRLERCRERFLWNYNIVFR